MPVTTLNYVRHLRCCIPGDAARLSAWDTGDIDNGFDDQNACNTPLGIEKNLVPVSEDLEFMWSIEGPIFDRMCLYLTAIMPQDSLLAQTRKTPLINFEIRHGISGVTKICVDGVIKAGQPAEPNLLVQVSGRLAGWWEFWAAVSPQQPVGIAAPCGLKMRALFDRLGGTNADVISVQHDAKLTTITFAE